jgi:hypothetical protein
MMNPSKGRIRNLEFLASPEVPCCFMNMMLQFIFGVNYEYRFPELDTKWYSLRETGCLQRWVC